MIHPQKGHMDSPAFLTKLSNGLTVHLKEIHTAPLISHWVWYRVGSRNEMPGKTGLSHWVEHLQFKGTPRFPPSILDKAISREGGVWNAFTYMDWTTYYETLPADRIGLALELEADRMVNSVFDPAMVEAERTVILSELEGNENEPLFQLGRAVQQASFRHHPYRNEVIGNREDLLQITREDLYQHYRQYYVPNNALVAIAGDFRIEEMLQRVREAYEGIPAGDVPPRNVPIEPPPSGERRLEVHGPGETAYIQVAYRALPAAHPDFAVLMVIDSLLSGPASLNMFGGGGISNKTSRLYRALVEKELAVGVGGGVQATIDPFLFEITITLPPVYRPEETLKAFDEQILRIMETPVTPKEIQRAIKQARALFAYGSENITNQAFWLGYAEMFDHYDWFVDYLERISRVTPMDVQRVAQQVLNPQGRVVGFYIPEDNHPGGVS